MAGQNSREESAGNYEGKRAVDQGETRGKKAKKTKKQDSYGLLDPSTRRASMQTCAFARMGGARASAVKSPSRGGSRKCCGAMEPGWCPDPGHNVPACGRRGEQTVWHSSAAQWGSLPSGMGHHAGGFGLPGEDPRRGLRMVATGRAYRIEGTAAWEAG